jgi:type IV pilus assembly protein PilA
MGKERGFTLIELMVVVAIIGVLAVLASYGVSRYLRTSKTAEATLNVGAIQKNAGEAMTRDKMSGAYAAPGKSTATGYGFCASEVAAVPATIPKARKYVSGKADWSAGKGAGVGGVDIGFYCLKFEIIQPQYYAYSYIATGTGTSANDEIDIDANGDLDGNGITSDFKMTGKIIASGGHTSLVWAPKPLATNPEE